MDGINGDRTTDRESSNTCVPIKEVHIFNLAALNMEIKRSTEDPSVEELRRAIDALGRSLCRFNGDGLDWDIINDKPNKQFG